MANQGTGMHKYERYFLESLGECLTSALVEVIKKKPVDPVEYLAHYLYNYRKNNPLEKDVRTIPKEHVPTHSDDEWFVHSSHRRAFQTDNVQVVHQEFDSVFKQLDDIFDDDDVT